MKGFTVKKFRSLFLVFLAVASAAGCAAQVQPSPPPSNQVTWPAAVCPSGQTCTAFSYIVSRATCPTPTTCPAVSVGNYAPLNQSTPSASASYNDTTPPPGVYVAYVIQVVEGGSPPVTGQPNIASAATLDASYPPTVGAATVTDLAELAPPLQPNWPAQDLVASNEVPVVARATVTHRRW